jgi:hypothetical protein
VGDVRDTYFNATFGPRGSERIMRLDATGNDRVNTVLNDLVPEHNVVIVLVNDAEYGGASGSIIVMSNNESSAEVALHEIGHNLALLGDEYDYAPGPTAETLNTTQETRRDHIRWRHWINDATAIPTPETDVNGAGRVGLFEGAAYNTRDWYRPTLRSKMREAHQPFYAVNEEAFVLAIYDIVPPITSTIPFLNTMNVSLGFQRLTFTVNGPTPTAPAPPMVYEWRRDGEVIPGETAKTITLASEDFGNGIHTLQVVVRDPTTKVRLDPGNLLRDDFTWILTLTNQGLLPPSYLRANLVANGSIDLSWRDRAESETGFVIERSLRNAAFAEVGRVAANVVSYNDATATPGTPTRYRVRAVSSAGGSDYLGGPSNVVAITPQLAPSPVVQPQSFTVNRGQRASFAVVAAGVPLSYQWSYNGVDIVGASRNVYAIPAAQITHEGDYDCRVFNGVGSYTSAVARLTVHSAPEIITQPLAQVVRDGQPTVFSIGVRGSPTVTFQWRFNGATIMGATAPTYQIGSPNLRDVGNYDCIVSNDYGSLFSRAAALTVLGAPIITTRPISQTVDRGQPAVFTVVATTAVNAPLGYQWRKAQVPIAGATAARFAIAAVRDSDVGSFDCVVTNMYGSATSSAATLAINTVSTADYRLVGARAGTARWQWAQQLGGTGADTVNDLTLAANTLLVGGSSTSAAARFGGLPLNNPASWAGRFGLPNGAAQWVRSVGTGAGIFSIAGDGAGNVFAAGGGLTDAAPPVATGLLSRFPIANGPAAWTRTDSTDGTDRVIAIAPGGGGAYYHVRRHGTASTLVKSQADGTLIWSRTMQSANSLAAEDLFVGGNGNVWVCGSFNPDSSQAFPTYGYASFANPSPTPATTILGDSNTSNGFVVAYDSNGNVLWADRRASELLDISPGVAGEIVLAGTEMRVAEPTAVALVISETNGDQLQRYHNTMMRGVAVAVSPGGEIALLMRSTPSGLTANNYFPNRGGFLLAKYSHGGALQWLLPTFGDNNPAASARARVVSSADGRLFVGLTLGAASSAEFAGINPFGMANRSTDGFTAAVIETPVIAAPPQSQMLALGAPLHLVVDVGGFTGSVTYQWLKDGRAIVGRTLQTLDVAITTLGDAGRYTCRVTGSGGITDSAPAVITIVNPQQLSLKAPAGSPLSLPVTAAGPELTYAWQRGVDRLFDVNGYTGTVTSQLRITAMADAFADTYQCRVTGPGGYFDVNFFVSVLPWPDFYPITPADAVVSGNFTQLIYASDATSYRFTGLPPGLIYNASNGSITGKPTAFGRFLVTVTATNAAGSAQSTFFLEVRDLQSYAKGSFQGTIQRQPWNSNLGGMVSLNVATTGAVTGSVRYAGATLPLSGPVDADASARGWNFSQRITRTGLPALQVYLVSPTALDGEFTGTISIEQAADAQPATVGGYQVVWNAQRTAAAYAGTFNATLALPAMLVGSTTVPQGASTMRTIVPASTGLAAWSGKLGDNTAFTGSCYLGPVGQTPVWTALYSNMGSLFGSPVISGANQTGTIDWTRLPRNGAPSWAAFPLTVTGSR